MIWPICCELTFAARATASFPGAFPALQIARDRRGLRPRRLAGERRAVPATDHAGPCAQRGTMEHVALIDGSVLVNAPFAGAIAALTIRPAQREVDRRFVYIDPLPASPASLAEDDVPKPVSFFGAIFGSLSTIPREQPIRDNLEVLEKHSREAGRLREDRRRVAARSRSGRWTGFSAAHCSSTGRQPKRLARWRARAQQAAAEQRRLCLPLLCPGQAQWHSGSTGRSGAQGSRQAGHAQRARDCGTPARGDRVARLANLSAGKGGGASDVAILFFRAHDLAFRIRRLRLLARRLSRDWELDPDIAEDALEDARDAVYGSRALFRQGRSAELGQDFEDIAADVIAQPGCLPRCAGGATCPAPDG